MTRLRRVVGRPCPRPGALDLLMLLSTDLRRLIFPTAGVTVAEHGAERLLIVTDAWMLSVDSAGPAQAKSTEGALRAVVVRSRECREDVLKAHDAPTIHRFLRGVQGPNRAAQADYVLSFGDAWATANACARDPGDLFDITAVDRLLLAFRLADRPRPECEVLPAWQTYQKRERAPGSPIAKFVLSMAPAPVRLGDYRAGLGDATSFTESDFRRGGRQVTPDLIEFYVSDDPPAIRVDLWLGGQPEVEDRDAVFDARLRVDGTSIALWSSFEPFDTPVPPGEYDVSISLLNRGKYSERYLVDEEWFNRDDLERYEVLLGRRDTD